MRRDRPAEPALSIVCVYNDPGVRRDCLDRSILAYDGPRDVDYVPVDNTDHVFTSAGAALNHGARQARHDLVVFVHQDVYLHSIDRLADAGAELRGDTWGLLGASGVSRQGQFVGRMRDRVQLIGSDAPLPVEVDSVDEVLFMVRRDRVLQHPLTEDPDLAWHAYAVEYGLRMRRLGLGVGAVNLAVTHNSMTINLDRLDVGHRRVAALYPAQQPVRTTCGMIGSRDPGWRDAPFIRRHRWRARWLLKSLHAVRARRRLAVPVVFSDIRHEVDLLRFDADHPLHLLNVDHEGGFAEYCDAPLTLTRAGKPVVFRTAASLGELLVNLRTLRRSESVLVTDLTRDDLTDIDTTLEHKDDWLAGMQPGGLWLLGGTVARDLPTEWSQPEATPLGSR